jgi:hypothetical protein
VFFDTPTICADAYHDRSVRVLIVEDEPFMAEAIRDVSALRKRLGEPSVIATVAGVGYRINTQPDTDREGGDRG